MKILWISLGTGVTSALVLIAILFLGSGTSAAVEPNVIYHCNETEQFVLGPLQPTPAVNLHTGKRTLTRALYCPVGEHWHALPPSEMFAGNPLGMQCPLHRNSLREQGPLPAEIISAALAE